jgi:hypothetical protein
VCTREYWCRLCVLRRMYDLLHTLSPCTPLLDDVGRSVGTRALRLRTYRCTSKWVSLGILFSRDCPPCEFDLRQVFYVPVCMRERESARARARERASERASGKRKERRESARARNETAATKKKRQKREWERYRKREAERGKRRQGGRGEKDLACMVLNTYGCRSV